MSTDEKSLDLDAIEARARKREPITMRPLPRCDHPERGHAPACFPCVSKARAAEGPTFHEHGRADVLALVAEVRRLRAALSAPAVTIRLDGPAVREGASAAVADVLDRGHVGRASTEVGT